MNRLSIDVDWAWSPYEPGPSSPWDLSAAAHLHRRAGFGASWATLQSTASTDPHDAISDLFLAEEADSFQSDMKRLVRASLARNDAKQLSAQWAYRMLYTPSPLLEKMTLFWHGHFATSAVKVQDAELMQAQNDLLRTHALGNFPSLLLEISRDPAMLLYLDSASNRKSHPNENYAREIMELFALGEGNYTEQDIRELARCFTGWEIKRKKFRFNRYQYDSGVKSVLGVTGKLSGEEGVAIVASQEAVARFLARKLARFFVAEEVDFPDELIEPLASELRDSDLEVGVTVKRILSSNLFFSPQVRARKIRSPVEFGIGFLLAFDGTTDFYQLADSFERLGQGLYFPPSVKGWDGGRAWINSSTLLGRANLIHRLVEGGKTKFSKQTFSEWTAQNDLDQIEPLIDRIEPSLFAVPLSKSSKRRVVELAREGPAEKARVNVARSLCTLPEFQLS